MRRHRGGIGLALVLGLVTAVTAADVAVAKPGTTGMHVMPGSAPKVAAPALPADAAKLHAADEPGGGRDGDEGESGLMTAELQYSGVRTAPAASLLPGAWESARAEAAALPA